MTSDTEAATLGRRLADAYRRGEATAAAPFAGLTIEEGSGYCYRIQYL